MKLKQIVDAYRRLDKATVNNLEEEDVIKILKARKAMRPYFNDYVEFEKDCQEKFKSEGLEEADKTRMKVFDKVKENKSYQPTKEEMDDINKVNEYFIKVNKALSEEQDKEIEITVEKLSDNAGAKLMKENGWKPYELDEIEVIL